ncbi:hypothetical protein ACQPZG_04910 (plasmid) [Streptomyces sp. CA-294286]|uniref:hypothetical protein n=1 Tax=Streptomyces sp. CA-294286 TaxID=3240070 RepID=UPI003D91CD89
MSIVGVDRIGLPYYRAKRESERILADSGLPWTVQRATQLPVPPVTKIGFVMRGDLRGGRGVGTSGSARLSVHPSRTGRHARM